MTTDLYLITCITNMHAGSGGTNYGIIDNLVQRDTASELPVIHSTSLKGALREFCTENGCDEKMVRHIFGSEPREGNDKTTPGNYKFFSAHLLSLPVRSDKRPYYNATCPLAINDFLEFCKHSNATLPPSNNANLTEFTAIANGPFTFDGNAAMLEGKRATSGNFDTTKLSNVKTYVGDNPALFQNPGFTEIVKALPVIARNQLENGISQNLWYEEVVPRQSRFYFAVLREEKDVHVEEFSKKIQSSLVQIGANATVGYGYCKITKL